MTVTKGEQRRQQERLLAEADRLYEQYGEPLEKDPWGEYIAINPGGEIYVGQNREEVSCIARERLGHGNLLFKIGPRATNTWL